MMAVRLIHFTQGLSKRGYHFSKGYRRKHADTVEEINEDAQKRMDLANQLAFGTVQLEPVVTAEIAHFHHIAIKLLCRATTFRIIERHLLLGKAKMLHHQIAEGLPWLHKMHFRKPST